MATVTPKQPMRGRNLVINAMYVTGFLDLFGVSLFLPHLVARERKYANNSFLLGVLLSTYGGIQLFSSPLSGTLSDRLGRKPVLLCCYTLTSLSYFGMAGVDYLFTEYQYRHSLSLIFIVRGLAGFVKHSQTLTRAVLSDLTVPSERAVVYGRFNAFSSFGFIVGPALSGHIMEASVFGFSFVCLLSALLFLLSAILLFFIPMTLRPASHCQVVHSSSAGNSKGRKTDDSSWSSAILLLRQLADVMSLHFLLSFSSLIYRSTLPLLMEDYYGLSPKGIGYITSFQGIFSAISSFLSGPVAKYFSTPFHEVFCLTGIYVVTILGLTYAPNWEVMLIFLVAYVTCNSLLRVAGAEIIILRSPPENYGSVVGLGQTVISLARMLAPLLAGTASGIRMDAPGVASATAATTALLISSRLVARINGQTLGVDNSDLKKDFEKNGLTAIDLANKRNKPIDQRC